MPDDKYIDTIEKDGESYGIRAEEAQIKGLIQADKDIISQIKVEYNETNDETTFTFPEGILPIRFYCNDNVYAFFNYIDSCIIDENGSILNITLVSSANDNVILVTSGEYGISFISELLYLGISGIIDTTNSYNWYKILNPSGGTKLYKHTIVFKDSGSSNTLTRSLISIDKNEHSTISEIKTLIDNRLLFLPNYGAEIFIKISQSGASSYILTIASIEYGTSSSTPSITVTNATSSWSGFEIVSDTVTEL